MSSLRVAIVGGGIAGVGVARALGARGVKSIGIYERGNHLAPGASSKNFGLVRLLGVREPLVAMTRRTIGMLAEIDRAAPGVVCRTGVLMYWAPGEAVRPWTTGVDDASDYEQILSLAAENRLDVERLTGDQAVQRLPSLRREMVERAVFSKDDVAVDLARLFTALRAELGHAGVQLAFGAAIKRVVVTGGRATGLELADGSIIEADVVVVAGGAWSAELAQRSGVEIPPLAISRRHLVTIPVEPRLVQHGPVAVRMATGFCVHGVLGAAVGTISDYTKIEPDSCTIDPAVAARFEAAFRTDFVNEFPAGAGVGWAGTRVQSELPGFVSGGHTYPRSQGGIVSSAREAVHGLFWLTALGGRGISCGLAAADDVAQEIVATSS